MPRKIESKQDLKKLIVPLIANLNKVAMFLCRDRDKAEDLVAETFLKACENIRKLKDKSKFKAWIFRILNNEFISNYRTEKKRNLVSLDEQIMQGNKSINSIDTDTLNIWSPNPEFYLVNNVIHIIISQV